MTKPLNIAFFIGLLVTALAPLTIASEPNTAEKKQVVPESTLLKNGVQLWAKNKPDLAEAEFKKAISTYPNSAQAHARLAGLLLTQNKTSEAVPMYQQAISLDPTNPKLFASLSIAYLHQSKFSMAKAMADEALKLDPKLNQVKKINEYIEAKQEVLQQTSKAKPNDTNHMPANHPSQQTKTTPEK
jgi:Tfp pilus assembly protein PilF